MISILGVIYIKCKNKPHKMRKSKKRKKKGSPQRILPDRARKERTRQREKTCLAQAGGHCPAGRDRPD